MATLLEKLKAGARNEREIVFPGTQHKIILRVLNDQDTLDASLAADRIFRDAEIPVAFQNVGRYEAEKDTQNLFRACIDPETRSRVSQSISDFRALLTNGVRDKLIEEYNRLSEECNPNPREMPEEEFDALVENLKKNPDRTLGNVSSFALLKRLVRFLANQLANSLKDSGSTS